MTTLLITYDFPPEEGGIQTHSYELAKNFTKLEEKVIVLTKMVPSCFNFDKMQNFKIIRMKDAKTCRTEEKYLKAFRYILWVTKKWDIERLYVTSWNPYGIPTLFVSKLFRIPFFVGAHGLDVLIPQKSQIHKLLLIFTLKNARKIIAFGSYQKKSLLKIGLSPQKICVVPEGTDPEKFNPDIDPSEVIKRHGLKGKKVILTVSRLVKRKGQDMVIRSLPNVLKEVPNAVYVLVGQGPEKEKLKEIAKDLGLEAHILFAGYVPDKDLPKYYNACDVFIMANREINGDIEGFGIVFLEANACCKPVIGGRSGGVGDAIEDGINGVLVNPLNVKEISDSLIKLLTDEEFSKNLGRNGRLRVERKFNYLAIAKEIRKIFKCSHEQVNW